MLTLDENIKINSSSDCLRIVRIPSSPESYFQIVSSSLWYQNIEEYKWHSKAGYDTSETSMRRQQMKYFKFTNSKLPNSIFLPFNISRIRIKNELIICRFKANRINLEWLKSVGKMKNRQQSWVKIFYGFNSCVQLILRLSTPKTKLCQCSRVFLRTRLKSDEISSSSSSKFTSKF